MFKRKECCVCSRCERREKGLFFIELYDFFKQKNSFGVATVFFISRNTLQQLKKKKIGKVLHLENQLELIFWGLFSKKQIQVQFGSTFAASTFAAMRLSALFIYLFFLLSTAKVNFSTVNSVSVHCSRTHKYYFLTTFSLKMGLTTLFIHLKIILLQCFQFQQNKFYPNRPLANLLEML